MPSLVLLLPDRPRLPGGGGTAPLPASALLDWLLLADDGQLIDQGQDLASALPASEQLVLLLPEQACSWHRVTLPRSSRKRWRAALVGLLEEELLEDPEQLQLAIEDEAAPGEACWVAATPIAPLRELIARIEGADGSHRLVDRILPRAWPAPTAQGHFFRNEAGLQLRWRDAEGVVTLPLRGGFARARYTPSLVQSSEWTSTAEAQEGAEQWLGMRVALVDEAEQARRALAGSWDLRQFELAPRLHGLRWLRQAAHQLMHKQWRAARIGLALLAATLVLGLNGLAWQQRAQIAQRQQQLEATLRQAFPRIGQVLEPALQMQRELGLLRAQAGELGEQDLETLIAVLASHWPEARGPVEALNFETGQLSLPRAGWSDEQIEQLRRQLASEQWELVQEQGRLIVKRSQG